MIYGLLRRRSGQGCVKMMKSSFHNEIRVDYPMNLYIKINFLSYYSGYKVYVTKTILFYFYILAVSFKAAFLYIFIIDILMIHKRLAIVAITALTLSIAMMVPIVGTSFADKVGPKGEDANKQGGIGEFYSKDGRAEYYNGISGQGFGDSLSDYAKSAPEAIGANSAFYASGECHRDIALCDPVPQ